jgi:hypothetical protein
MHMPIAGGRPQDSTRSCGEKTEKGAEATGDNQAKGGGWGCLRPITGLVECPTLRPDGTFLRGEP